MGKNKEELIKQTQELSKRINDMDIRLYHLLGKIEKLTEQIKELKAQQPIIINPSLSWPTNDPTQPTQPYPWWQYTPTITSTTMEIKNTGDAK